MSAEKLSVFDLVAAVLSFLPGWRFSDRQFMDFFLKCLGDSEVAEIVNDPSLSGNERRSNLIRTLSILEIGRFLEVLEPFDGQSRYRIVPSIARVTRSEHAANARFHDHVAVVGRLAGALRDAA